MIKNINFSKSDFRNSENGNKFLEVPIDEILIPLIQIYEKSEDDYTFNNVDIKLSGKILRLESGEDFDGVIVLSI